MVKNIHMNLSDMLTQKYEKIIGCKKISKTSIYGDAYSFLLLGALDIDFSKKFRRVLLDAKKGNNIILSGIISEDYGQSLLKMSYNVRGLVIILQSKKRKNIGKYHNFPIRNIVHITVEIENNTDVFSDCINGKHLQ